jgi:hypothetical protein
VAAVLPATGAVAFVGAVMAAGAVALAGAAACWAKAPIGRIARAEATSRLEMRVMVVFLFAGDASIVPTEEDKAI